jgi:hypothetical protein
MPYMKDLAPLPGAHYGKIQEQPKDGDPLPEPEGMDDDDDELMPVTDPHLVAMLGFDPLEFAEEDEPTHNDDGSLKE